MPHRLTRPLAVATAALTFLAAQPPAYDEPLRPQFHFTPAHYFMNDPNGLVFYKGEYHLFYQHNPLGEQWGHMSWGHAVSPDLLHWRHLPVALHEADGVMIFSGSVVVDWHNTSGFCTATGADRSCLVAVYTGHGHGKQTQNLAHSTDRGRTWTKFAGNPVIDENLKEFRDPKVCWHAPTKRWVMVVALSEERKVRFYSSPDLKKWTQSSEFGGQGNVEGAWECPDLFPLTLAGKTYWILVVNVGWGGPAGGGSAAQYFIGDFDGITFRNGNPKDLALWTNHGPDSYAEQTWSDVPASDGRRISMGWMSSTRYCTLEPTLPWRGALTLPRELSLVQTKSGARLAQLPVRELSRLRAAALSESDFATAGQTLEINATLDRAMSSSFAVCAGDRTQTVIGYDAATQQVYVDRTKSHPGAPFHKDFQARYAAPLISHKDADIPLRIFVDRTSVEVFADDGLSVLSVNTFPDPAALRFEPPASGVKSLRLWRLNSIWKTKD